jgi:hypothetical protein
MFRPKYLVRPLVDSNITVIESVQLHSNEKLVEHLGEILRPYYEDCTLLMERELNHNNVCYAFTDAAGEITSFALFAYEQLAVAGGLIPALYVGLAASREDVRNKGLVFKLWAQARQDILESQDRNQLNVVGWATTVTPEAYLGPAKLSTLDPKPNGSYSPRNLAYAEAIRHKLGVHKSLEHPFVLKGIAAGTRYSEQERNRIRRICTVKKFTLFDELNIDESQGDRLLMIGHFRRY